MSLLADLLSTVFERRLMTLAAVPGDVVKMRADLLRLGRKDPELSALDLDFQHLFASWFNRGFLVLRPISWESPAHILEKIIQYEAVHAIDSWEDLRRRLEPGDRRCFAFFHPAMPDEPLIFVEVALTRKVPGSVQALLAEDRAPMAAPEADTAVFYSISNCQAGLAGISFGNSLIKQVAADLARELPAGRALSDRGQARRRAAAGSGGAVPSGQWRAGASGPCKGRSVEERTGPIGRGDGELSLRAAAHRPEP
jgi:hypothetical protein